MSKIVLFRLFLILSIIGLPLAGHAKGVEFTKGEELPRRIIRVCCSFGSNVGIVGVPFFKLTEITGVEDIGKHHYLGSKLEGNGIIYTRKGGFIDLAHLRDNADWTAYLYHVIQEHKGIKNFEFKLGNEGGLKKLCLNIPTNISDDDMMALAGRIAYDLSVWHEIATWFGANSIPFLPEQYSSFSVEDDYSNLLGVTLAIEALKSDLPYEEAMTELIFNKLVELERVDSVSQTYDAMEMVLNKWWTRDFKFPQANVTLKREFSNLSYSEPLIVPGFPGASGKVNVVYVPSLKDRNLSFDDLYVLQIHLSSKLNSKKNVGSNNRGHVITNKDFHSLIEEVNEQSNKKLSKLSKRYQLQ